MAKILVCGYGSIGKKHALNLKKLGADIKIWRHRANEGPAIRADGFIFEPALDDGLVWCDGVVIATSTDHHLSLAIKAAKLQKAIYLEKPVSLDKIGVDELLQHAKGCIIEVGCQMRQHPNLKALHEQLQTGKDGRVLAFQAWVGQRLDQWRPGTDYKASYSADAARGGGALFDLVHEIDLMVWLVGSMSSVYADLRQNSDLDMKAEDLANLVLVAKNGAAGTVQLDMLSPAYRRGMQVVCEKAVYRYDMQEGILWRAEGNDPALTVHTVPDNYAPAQMLFDAMTHFLKRIDNHDLPTACSLEEGVHSLDILLAARTAHETGQKQILKAD